MNEPKFSLGNDPNERITVRVVRRNQPDALDYWDGNWVTAEISISVGAFLHTYDAQLRTNEFASFRSELKTLYESLSGRASFAPMEPWIEIEVTGDSKGHFVAECIARDDLASEKHFTHSTRFDETELATLLRDLDAIASAFPVFAGTT